MGDRADVDIYVREQDVEPVSKLLIDAGYQPFFISDVEADGSSSGLFCQSLAEVNYAKIGIEAKLQKALVPYDKHWSEGCEYGAGSEYFRIVDGEPVLKNTETDDGRKALEGLISVTALREAIFDGMNSVNSLCKEAEEAQKVADWDTQTHASLVVEPAQLPSP